MTETELERLAATAGGKSTPVNADDPKLIIAQLESCLAALDRAGAGIAAAHLSVAIDHARAAFSLGGNTSGTD
jgi:hypothetical protein